MTAQDAKVRSIIGTVSSDKMDKTRIVKIIRKVKHPHLGKFIARTTKLHVHDANNESKSGDTVLIQESRPISKTKSWVLREIVSRLQTEA